MRTPSKTPERQKNELFKKAETLEKDMKEMKEMLQGKLINNLFFTGRSDCGCEVHECWSTKDDADR